MKIRLSIITFLFMTGPALGQSKYQKDFAFYWNTVNENFAYFGKQKTNWDKVRAIYQAQADTITSKRSFIRLLETVNHELYNGHVFLNTNTPASNRSIPTGADMKGGFDGQKCVIREVRGGFNADLCGLKPGMEIVKVNGVSVQTAVQKFLPKSVDHIEKPMYDYAVNTLLAGTHDTPRKITVKVSGTERTFEPDAIPNKTESGYTTLLESRRVGKALAYIRINNSLGNTDLIKVFDAALDSLSNSNGLILDLRETPSGGNTTVARAIMGRFISKEMPYQKHIYVTEEKETGVKRSTLELVSPRGKLYSKPVVILVGYWTGSMGEGLAIGFDAMKLAKIAGTRMAGLLGEIYTFKTPELNVPFSFPCVQLQHVNGQPREDFEPLYPTVNQAKAVEFAATLLLNKK